MRHQQLFQQCEQFEKLAQEFKAPKLPVYSPYQSGERPAIRHRPEAELPSPQKSFEEAHRKSKGMIISKEQALEEVKDNGVDPAKFIAEMGDSDFYKAREVLLWIMEQE